MDFGVCYYPEQWPRERWAVDAAEMAAIGINLVRIGEFAWAQMEPQEGRYEWSWLDEAIETLAAAGHRVLLGTPTATPPAWLTHAYPDVLRVERTGRPRRHGTRRQGCPSSPRYRAFSASITGALAARYGTHPAVVGWQIDNEFGGGHSARCYCERCRSAFQRWLRARYGALADLNEAWGAAFWSQLYSAWEQIGLPDDTIDKANPSHELDYFRFASDAFVEFQQLQVDLIRRHAPGRIVTTNLMGLFNDLDPYDLAAPLDVATWDSYPTGNPDRWRPQLYPPDAAVDRTDPAYAYDAGDPYITGMAHALTYGLRQAPFWVMEQQCGHINWGRENPGIRAGTVRLWTWHAVAAGASKILYFRWRPSVMAHEQYHSAILRHDGTPDLAYRELDRRLRPEQALLDGVADADFPADVALLCRFEDLWAIELQPHRADYHYWRPIFLYHQLLQQLGLNVHLVPPRAELSRYKLLVAPTVHVVDDEVVARLAQYVDGGGTLLLGVRSGFKTSSNRVPLTPLPGRLRSLVGATVDSWQALPAAHPWPLDAAVAGLEGSAGYWVETLLPEEAEVLATYGKGGPAALTRRSAGAGAVYYLGWYPSPKQARALLGTLLDDTGIVPWAGLPAGLVAYRRGRQRVLLNFTDVELRVTPFGGGPELVVGARDVVVVPLAA